MFAITTDSTCDLSPQQLAYSGVRTVSVPLNHLGQAYDERDLSPERLVELVQRTGQPATTGRYTAEACAAVFDEALQEADGVIHLASSSRITPHYEVARRAARGFGGRVRVIDTQSVTYGLGIHALHAAHLADTGAGAGEIEAALPALRGKLLLVCAVEKLDFLKINGRLGGVAAFVGNLLGVRPLLELREGRLEAAGRARGGGAAMRELARQVQAFSQGLQEPLQLHFLYAAGGEAAAEDLRAQLAFLHAKDFGLRPFGAGLNANTGPGAVGVGALPASLSLGAAAALA